MSVLYKFEWDYGSMGNVEGLFVAKATDVKKAIGKTVYFGEILGKHSEVDGELDADDFTVISTDEKFIRQLVKVIGSTTISGYNPLNYLDEDEDE